MKKLILISAMFCAFTTQAQTFVKSQTNDSVTVYEYKAKKCFVLAWPKNYKVVAERNKLFYFWSTAETEKIRVNYNWAKRNEIDFDAISLIGTKVYILKSVKP